MAFVSQAFEWLRALLFGTRPTDEDSRTRSARTYPDQPAHEQVAPISSAMMSAYLALGRLHRAQRAARRFQGESHPPVPTYVFPPVQQQHALHAGELTGVHR
ncbi:hypothetical protein [Streptomyces sp. AK08-02]|uniref:hypothetical protein n=1 Tax=Streptomyces sp. AK08-02 TaxID=3028654 RepID=UPI0029BD4A7A|nr:hypothetical protein [Streptomyces sp. AK08-02]MDX3752427.1 hypothetical protein [Streptomyces sp. AK08-02]